MSGHPTTLQHPLQLLYPLEISHCTEPEKEQAASTDCIQIDGQNENESNGSAHVEVSPRLQRTSASRARDRFKEWSMEILDNVDESN